MYPKCTQVLMFDTLFLYLFLFAFITMVLSAFLPRLKGKNSKLVYIFVLKIAEQ